MKSWFLLPLLPVALALATPRAQTPPAATQAEADRSPTDLALTGDGRTAVVANRSAGTLSVVSLGQEKPVRELKIGAEPVALALTSDGKSAVAALFSEGALALAPLDGGPAVKIPIGAEPRGVALSPDGKSAWATLSAEDAVVQVSLESRKILKKLPVEAEPWSLALSRDGRRLVVGCTRGRSALVLDAAAGKTLYSVPLAGRNVRQIALSSDGGWAYVPFIAERLASATRQNIDRGWVVGNRLGRVPLTEEGPREAITLDSPGDAVADVSGVALSPDGATLALTAAGTHELVLLSRPAALPFVAYGGPGDHSEAATRTAMRRVALGGGPRAVRFTPDGKTLVVANYFSDSVQLVDAASGKLTKTIVLGKPKTSPLAREGEQLFHDATRSFGSWYSCASCHTEGHTNGGLFDTLNDGGYGKPKKTPSLRGVAKTAPYTWHGWQKSLKQAIHDSFVNSMQGPEPSERDILAVEAYLKTLEPLPSPIKPSAASARGAALFKAKGCASCHGGPDFTAPMVGKIGLEEPDDEYVGFNPPSLRGVWGRAPYLHDGRAATLDEVLSTWHRPSKLTGQPDPTPAERADLIAYLKTL